jgi:DNA-directed RNA polymerase subunit RPC12/RpoP
MRIEGDCPECESRLGVKIRGRQAEIFGNVIRKHMDKDGNGVRCQHCDEYVEPTNNEIHD